MLILARFIILLVMAVVLITSASLVIGMPPSYAANPTETAQGAQTVQGAESVQGAETQQHDAGRAPRYLSNLYLWFLGFIGIAALLAMVIGGVMYMFAGANLTQTEAARKWITNAIWGIVLAAFSYLLLNTINPDLVGGFNIQTVIEGALKK